MSREDHEHFKYSRRNDGNDYIKGIAAISLKSESQESNESTLFNYSPDVGDIKKRFSYHSYSRKVEDEIRHIEKTAHVSRDQAIDYLLNAKLQKSDFSFGDITGEENYTPSNNWEESEDYEQQPPLHKESLGDLTEDEDNEDVEINAMAESLMAKGYTHEQALVHIKQLALQQQQQEVQNSYTPVLEEQVNDEQDENASQQSGGSVIEALMSQGYTREQATKKYELDKLRLSTMATNTTSNPTNRSNHANHQATNKISDANYVLPLPQQHSHYINPNLPYPIPPEAAYLDRNNFNNYPPQPNFLSPHSLTRSGSADSRIERELFHEPTTTYNSHNHHMSSNSFNELLYSRGMVPEQSEEEMVQSLMSSGFTREQALRQVSLQASELQRSHSNSQQSIAASTMNRSIHSHSRSVDSRQFNNYSHSSDSDHYNNTMNSVGGTADAYSQLINTSYLQQKNYAMCYFTVELDDDEAFEVALLVSRGLKREAAIYVYFKSRMLSCMAAITVFRARMAAQKLKSVDERALDMGLLLSSQVQQVGINMLDSLASCPHDQIGVDILMELGLTEDDAALFLFENRVAALPALPDPPATNADRHYHRGSPSVETNTTLDATFTTSESISPNATPSQAHRTPHRPLFHRPSWFLPLSNPEYRRQMEIRQHQLMQQREREAQQVRRQQEQQQQQERERERQQQQQQRRQLNSYNNHSNAHPHYHDPNPNHHSYPNRNYNNYPNPNNYPNNYHYNNNYNVHSTIYAEGYPQDDPYLDDLRRRMRYDKVKRRDVETVMNVTFSSEEQAVSALTQCNQNLQEAIQLVLNST